jgi:hypothetical protein
MSYAYQPKPMPREGVAQMVSRAASAGAPPDYIEEFREVLSRQAWLPPISHVLYASTDDAVWLARERIGASAVRWYRFTPPDGATGFVELPWKSRVVAAAGNLVWIAEKDEFDVSYITRYRIDGLAASRR